MWPLPPPFASLCLTSSQQTHTVRSAHTYTLTLSYTYTHTHMSFSDRWYYCLVAGVTEVFSGVLLQRGDEPLCSRL